MQQRKRCSQILRRSGPSLLLEQSFAEMVNYNALVMSAVSGENVENVLRELKKFVIKGASGKSSEGQTEKDDSPWNL